MEHEHPLSDAEDATLVARATDGDVRAFEVLARRHGPLMRDASIESSAAPRPVRHAAAARARPDQASEAGLA